jgi:AAHS family 4-hydroxybenzoate transporter-like MFS transporter
MAVRDTTLNVAALLDSGRWTLYQRWLVALVAVTIVFDGIDNQLLGIVIPTLRAEWNVPRSAFAPVISLGYLGMMVGGMVAGLAGDRLGRRTGLLGSMIVFGVLTMAAALVDSPGAMGALRFFAGIGLGGAMPNAATLVAEYVPARLRPIAVTITIVCVPLGGTLAGVLGVHALPLMGWRNVFIVAGAVPLAAAIVLRFILPESPHFLARRERRWVELAAVMTKMGHTIAPGSAFVDPLAGRQAPQASVGSLFSTGVRRDTMALWGAFFSCLLAVYLAFSWLTTLLTGAGFSGATASTGIIAINLGGVVGALVGGVAVARFGSKPAMLTMTLVAIGGAGALALMEITSVAPLAAIMAMLTLTGSMINGVQTTMYALAAHIYPTTVRATGVGAAVAFGRIGAVMTGFVGSWAVDYGGTHAFFGVITGMMVLTFVALAVVRRHVPAGASVPDPSQ